MKIKVCAIDKKGKKELYNPLIEHYIKISKPFAKVELLDIFNNKIANAQDSSANLAQLEYAKAFDEHLGNGSFNIVLDPLGKEVDSFEFAKLLEKQANTTFFIGGAYGFDINFKKKCNLSVSFGKITMSHKLVKVILMEQIYRGLTIINNHPYHK
jgi:23S rRNA (pseudouridine1915-N3)-methyltransferase